ncbi:MAG TPA: DUF1707 domain-containing protein [Longimicrobiaceae bacterium]|nr:DUF1707 domain-containing protein [Longimicrobiaceae bacterium]
MTDKPYLSPAMLEQRRDRVIDALTEHYAYDHLDDQELEKRIDQAYQTTAITELDALIADLPALPASPLTRVPETAPDFSLAHAEEVRERQFILAIMGATERRGVWTPARKMEVVALMGGVELDFREARFAPGVTQIDAFAIMGGIEIRVPPGIRVECSGFGIMGAFEGLDKEPDRRDSRIPTLRINGLALMGAIEVKERLPRESDREAKQRLREEKRRLRRRD